MTTLYAATMSLDGFIAGPHGEMSWLSECFDEQVDLGEGADTLVHDVGCLLVGGRTHRGEDPNAGTEAEGAFGGVYDGPAVVLSRRPPATPEPGVEHAADVRTAVDRATALAGDRYVNVLGAGAARSCLEAGLLDEVLMFVAPVMLGEGVRMLDRPGAEPVRLDRKPGTTALWFTVRR